VDVSTILRIVFLSEKVSVENTLEKNLLGLFLQKSKEKILDKFESY
jgi:hypothetical protein